MSPERIASTVRRRIAREGEDVILYDESLAGHVSPDLFDRDRWAGSPTAPGYAGGRGATLFIRHQDQDWVLRHYHRGGTVGRVLADRFLWLGESRTRAFREWDLLAALHGLGLPSPRPVAARYRRRGLSYTADLVTVRIPDVEPLSTRLARAGASPEVWSRVGACVRRFHEAGVWHADLTAHNLQIDSADRIFLLDFDRGRFRPPGGGWRRRNLDRLHRSLTKISRDGSVRFGTGEWEALLAGYGGSP
jgi:3-deoxy-D-manno-octulosonic acid kinase